MNLAIRGIEGNIGPHNADTFPQRPAQGPEGRLHPRQSAVQHQRLGRRAAPRGRALEVRRAAGRQRQLRLGAAHQSTTWPRPASPGSSWPTARMSSNQSGEGEIRQRLVEADLVDCMIALPGQLFYTTQIPVCLWFLARSKKNGKFRDRRGQTLFIDARKLGRSRRPHAPRTDPTRRSPASPRPTTPGAARRTPANTRTWPASARARPRPRSRATASC